MTFQQMGEVFAYLLAYREVSADPGYRKVRPDERRIAGILENAFFTGDLDNLESFLNAQGFTIKVYDSTYFGKTNKDDVRKLSSYFVFARIDTAVAPYIDRDWFDKNFIDKRREKKETKDERVVWGVQLWLLLQYLFYTRLGRTVGEVSRFHEAVATEAELVSAVKELIEKMRNEGRPEGDKGVVWDILVRKSKASLETRTNKFLELMEKAGMVTHIKDTGNKEAFRQTLLAATEMSLNINRGLDYLKPPDAPEGAMTSPVDVIKGYIE